MADRSIRKQPEECQVCGMPAQGAMRGCVVVACDACKKFFWRNQANSGSFVCTTGRGQCFNNQQSPSPSSVSHPNLLARRNYCIKCRLVKCFEVGMHPGTSNKHQNTSSSSSLAISQEQNHHQVNTTSVILAKKPQNGDCLAGESLLKTLLSAVAELSVMHSVPWANHEFPNDVSVWCHSMGNFNVILNAGVSYAKILQSVSVASSLPLGDRCSLFSRAIVPLLVIQVTLPGCPQYQRFFGMNENMRRNFLHYFPMYKILAEHLDKIAATMETWQPSFIEFGILQAMIFFRTDALTNLTCPQIVIAMNKQLRTILDWYLERDENAELKKHLLFRIYNNMLAEFERDYLDIITRLSYNRPDLMHFNRLFAEMYHLPVAECQQTYNCLGLPPLGEPKPRIQ